ncbi:MAG: glycoside hydrolase domain-containing protein [Tepidisphaerales bacterium]
MPRSLWLLILLIALPTLAQQIPIPNPSFEEGTDKPAGWKCDGTGQWLDSGAAAGKRAVAATGNGQGSSVWVSDKIAFEPSSLYLLRFKARSIDASGGTAISGPPFANRDLGHLDNEWKAFETAFFTPDQIQPAESFLRFGQWEVTGSVAFDDVELLRAVPVYEHADGIELGTGENVDGNQYTFESPQWRLSSNFNRPLLSHRTGYNTNRWNLARDGDVIYRHNIKDRAQDKATVQVGVCYHTKGELTVEASTDQKTWQTLGTIDKVKVETFAIPASLLPAKELFVRLRTDDAYLQVDHYLYRCQIDGSPLRAIGNTTLMAIRSVDPRFTITPTAIVGKVIPGSPSRVFLHITNPGEKLEVPAVTRVIGSKESPQEVKMNVTRGNSAHCPLFSVPSPGSHTVRLEAGGFVAEMAVNVAELHETRFGARLPQSSEKLGVWWAPSGWKISRERPVPAQESDAIRISAAKNETEAAQFVLRPGSAVSNLSIRPGDLAGPEGSAIPASAIEVLREQYVYTARPTDGTGTVDYWPDPLPPITGPLALEPSINHPFWLRIHVPRNAKAGVYNGTVQLTADGVSVAMPLRLEVYDFALPDRMTCTTAFGFSLNNVFRYQKLEKDADKRAVLDKYFASFAAHHISPYQPAPLDPIKVSWPDKKNPLPVFDFTAWDAAMERNLARYHFNSFQVDIPGMGGGTFHQRYEPELHGFKENTPEYKAAFTAYCRTLQEHLRQKGWLGDAFVYWFDEPDRKDYEFVANGFRRLKEAGPDLNRMLTVQVEPELTGGPNIWCPITPNYNHDRAEVRRKAGEKFWWYVCTGPKAPFTTLFLDHPSTELRVWLWQTWQRRIDGILVWDTNYWTSSTAYPEKDKLQNPYEDPMSWQSGYGAPSGAKQPWGNGDGRFIYPPAPAAGGTPVAPVLDGPVDSIRLEMLRDGIEDYEYLAILRKLLAEKGPKLPEAQRAEIEELLKVPADITTDMTHFTRSPDPIDRQRERIARAIEKLAKP